MTGDVINKSQLVSIATGVVKATNPTLLKDFGGNLMLTEKWARRVLEKPKWNKYENTNGIVYPSLQFLEEEKLSFQRNISALVTEHDTNTRKYTFSFKCTKNVSTRDMDYKRQIRVIFAVSSNGDFLSIRSIHSGKTKRSLPPSLV